MAEQPRGKSEAESGGRQESRMLMTVHQTAHLSSLVVPFRILNNESCISHGRNQGWKRPFPYLTTIWFRAQDHWFVANTVHVFQTGFSWWLLLREKTGVVLSRADNLNRILNKLNCLVSMHGRRKITKSENATTGSGKKKGKTTNITIAR